MTAILVTGCSSGIGRALAVALHERGHNVFASARSPEALADTGLQTLALDVTNPRSIEVAVTTVLEKAGGIDMLINNAGVNAIGPLMEQPLERLRGMFETNVVGMLAVAQAVFPHMARRNSGRIVNIGSIAHVLPTPFGGAYAASKAAVHMLCESMRMEVAPFGVEVVEVQPGAVRSRIADGAAQGIERYREGSYRAAYDGIVKRAFASQASPMDAEVFAARLADAILAPRVPRLVRIGNGVRTLPLLATLPRSMVERAMARRFGLASVR